MHSEPNAKSYLFFWDKLEKCNYYLELSIELAEEPFDSRIVCHLAQECRIRDGGQYEMVRLPYLNNNFCFYIKIFCSGRQSL